MLPPLTPDLLPAAAGTAVLVLLAVVLMGRTLRRRRVRKPGTVTEAPTPTWTEPPAVDRVGSGRTVASAVARALAAREHASPNGRGDARDRLLAVLLDDPVRAVSAAAELESSRRQLDRLNGAVAHERAALRDVLARLAAAGLAPDQVARLSGLSDAELNALLRESAIV